MLKEMGNGFKDVFEIATGRRQWGDGRKGN